jgi:hypothetical protein
MSIFLNHLVAPSVVTPLGSSDTQLDPKERLQLAFEKLDIDELIQLFKEGADPYQEILYTKPFVKSFLEMIKMDNSNAKKFIYSMNENELRKYTDDQDLINRVMNFQQEIEGEFFKGGAPVSNERAQELALELDTLYEYFQIDQGNVINQTPIQIAASLRNAPLTEALIHAGVDVSHPNCFTLSDNQKIITLKNMLNQMIESGKEISLSSLEDPTLSKAERVSKMLALLGINEDQISFSYPGFFKFSDLRTLSESEGKFIDLLLENRMPLYRLVQIDGFALQACVERDEKDFAMISLSSREKVEALLDSIYKSLLDQGLTKEQIKSLEVAENN